MVFTKVFTTAVTLKIIGILLTRVRLYSVIIRLLYEILYICIVHTVVLFQSLAGYILSNTTRQILTRTHYIGDMFRITF
jgi:hypothetical protein